MSKNLYVGNLSYSVSNAQLGELFSKYGNITKVDVLDQRGFGFVEMENDEEALKAIEELNDSDFEGRKIIVNEARPKKKKDENRGRGRNRSGNRGGRRY